MPDNYLLNTSFPCLGAAEKLALERVLDSGYLGMGPEVAAFENELADFLGSPDSVVCVSSGTSALHLACEAIGLGPGDEVLVPSLTFVASFQAIAASGATPVACDVRLKDGLLDLANAEQRLGPRTRAIMPVFYAGYPGNVDELYEFAHSNGLRIIEDAAHAFGTRASGHLIGSRGDITCFSFDPIKNITSGEGGAITSRDQEVLYRARQMRQLGICRNETDDFNVYDKGWRYQMPDLMAAIGRTQLKRFEQELLPARKTLQKIYRQNLSKIKDIKLLETSDEVVPHIVPIRLPRNRRDAIREALLAEGFDTRVHYKPNHLLERFRIDGKFPVSEKLFLELLTLPTHPGVSTTQVERISEIIRNNL